MQHDKMESICSSAFEFENDELKRCYRKALTSSNKHLATIQSLEKDLGHRYLEESLLKDAVHGLYRQSLELSEHLHKQHPAVNKNDVAQAFSDKLLRFQVDFVRFSEGKVSSAQDRDMKVANQKIGSLLGLLQQEIHALKSEMVQMSMQENQQVAQLKQQMEELKSEVERKDLSINILAEKLKSSKDNKCNELNLLTNQLNRLLEDNELHKISEKIDINKIAELKKQLKESKRVISSKDDEIASLKLKLNQHPRYDRGPGYDRAPASHLIQPLSLALAERLVQNQAQL